MLPLRRKGRQGFGPRKRPSIVFNTPRMIEALARSSLSLRITYGTTVGLQRVAEKLWKIHHVAQGKCSALKSCAVHYTGSYIRPLPLPLRLALPGTVERLESSTGVWACEAYFMPTSDNCRWNAPVL